jgi:GTP-binding protein
MFIDEVRINVKAGNGGSGLVTFRREKYVPRGGPSGGDGGNGGSVILTATLGLRTLLDFRYRQHFLAKDGEPGGSKDQAGRSGPDLVVSVPQGTVVWDDSDGRLLADLTTVGQRVVIARGGRGGRGNARFATSTERAPDFAEKGEPGPELHLRLELKLIADAGLIGLPNAGKSTFLAKVSAARPKIADYPFTTLAPNLGVVAAPGREGESFVLADIPGLIKGAHAGSGLGDKFLRHVERTSILVHLVDVSAASDQDPGTAYDDIRNELALYDPGLAKRPEIVVATKMDLPGAEEGALRLEEHIEKAGGGRQLFRASPLTGAGLTPVLHAVLDALATSAPIGWTPATSPGVNEREVFAPSSAVSGPRGRVREFTISVVDGVFVVSGESVERAVVMTDLANYSAVRRLRYILKRRGVSRALRAAGARPGALVRVGQFEFDFVE